MNIIEKILKIKIDEFICISLKTEETRRKKVIEIFKKLKIPIKFYLPEKNKDPVKGCLESHLYCINYAKQKQLKNICIFEDDVDFLNLDLETFKNLNIPNDYDMIYLGYHCNKGFNFNSNLIKIESGLTTHSYIINSNIYDIVLKDINKEWEKNKNDLTEMEKPFFENDLRAIDKFYAREIHNKRKKTFGVFPLMTTQREEFSNIENCIVNYTELFKSKAEYFYNIKKSFFRGEIVFNKNRDLKDLLKELKIDRYDYILINQSGKNVSIDQEFLINPNEPIWDIYYLNITENIFYIRGTFLLKSFDDLYKVWKYSNNEFPQIMINEFHSDKKIVCVYTDTIEKLKCINFEKLKNYEILICSIENNKKYKKYRIITPEQYNLLANHKLILIDYINFFIEQEMKNAENINLILINDTIEWDLQNISPLPFFYNFIKNIETIYCNDVSKTCSNLKIMKNDRIKLIKDLKI